MGASRSTVPTARPSRSIRTSGAPHASLPSVSSTAAPATTSTIATSLSAELPPLPFASVEWQSSPSCVPQAHASFASLVSLIPPHFYLPRSDPPHVIARHSPTSRAAPTAAKTAAKSARLAKLDPSNHPSVAQLAAARVAAQVACPERRDPSWCEADVQGESENESLRFAPEDDDEATMHNGDDACSNSRKRKRSADDDDSTATTEATVRAPAPALAPPQPPASATDVSTGNLRARLQARIAALRASRQRVPDEPVGGSDESNTGSVADLLAERRRRGEMRDRRRRERKEARRAEAVTAAAAAAASPSPSFASLASRASPALSARSPSGESAFKHPALWTPVPAAPSSTMKEREAFSPAYGVDSVSDTHLTDSEKEVQVHTLCPPQSSQPSSALAFQGLGIDSAPHHGQIVNQGENLRLGNPGDGTAPLTTSLRSSQFLLPTPTPSGSFQAPKAPAQAQVKGNQAPSAESARMAQHNGNGKAKGKPGGERTKGGIPHPRPNKHGHRAPHDSHRPGIGARALPGKAKAARPGFEGRASALRARATARKGKDKKA